MSITYRSAKGSKLTSDEVDGNFQYLEGLVGGDGNTLITQNGFTLVDQDLTMTSGWVWKILGTTYSNPSSVVINIPFATTGNSRIDLVVANSSNTFTRIAGVESTSNPVAPTLPINTILVTFYEVTDGTISETSSPITGSIFKKKTESLGYGDPSLSGTNAVIQLRPEGNSRYAFSNPLLVSIDGFGLSLISGNLNAEAPYDGKDLFIENTGTTPITLLHDGPGTANSKFFFLEETDLIIPAGGKVWLKYGNPYCEVIFKSWNIAPYKVYTALLTQSGTSAPVAVVLQNTIGDIIWGRSSAGVYSVNLTAAFPANRTFCSATFSYEDAAGGGKSIGISRNGDNVVLLRTADSLIGSSSTDGLMLEPTSIEIRVYN